MADASPRESRSPAASDPVSDPCPSTQVLAPESPDASWQGLLGQVFGLAPTDWLLLLRADQCRRWQKGDRVPVEAYLEKFPELTCREDLVLDLVYSEVLLREELGETPQLEEYQRRFPRYHAPLAQQFAVHRALGKGSLWPASAAAGESGASGSSARPRPLGTMDAPPDADVDATAEGPAAPAWPEVPGYEILGELGAGGIGIVYRARQARLKRQVALKMLRDPDELPGQLARFRAEAEMLAHLQHANIVQVYEVGEHQGRAFLALEYVEGGSLDRRLAGEPQSARLAAQVSEALARAIHAAHQKGVVHRDLKPANVLVAAGPTVPLEGSVLKICDFGLAKQIGGDTVRTGTGTILGTASYMAPEQTTGRPGDVGPHADTYALGAILYELLTGRPPFRAATLLDTLDQVRYQEPVAPRQLQPKVPRDLETICLKCLQKEPPRRYATALELAEDLHRFQAGEPIKARPVGSVERVLKWAHRRPAAAGLVVVGIVFLLAMIGGLTYLTVSAAQRADRLSAARQEIRHTIDEGSADLARDRLEDANVTLTKAQAGIGPGPEWADLRGEVDSLLQQVQAKRDQQAARRQAVDRQGKFIQLRDKALLHATLSVGRGQQANLQAARDKAREALAEFGGDADLGSGLVLPPALLDAEKEEIRQDCYRLLLVLADVVAQPLPGQKPEDQRRAAREALRLLDRAASLGLQTRAYHQRQARYLRQLGDRPDSVAILAAAEDRKAQAIQPTSAVDYYLLGDEAYKRGRLDEAARHFESALALKPDHFWARYFACVCYLRQGEAPKAQVGLTNCLNQNDFVWLHLMLGFANNQSGKFDEAEANFARALQMNPDRDELYALYANRGVLRVRQKKIAQAVEDLQKASALCPERYESYLTLAEVYQSQKKLPEALAQLDRALKAEPVAEVYRSRARVHLEMNHLDAALQDFQQAIRRTPADRQRQDLARDHVARGVIYNRKKEYAAADRAFEEALKAWPGSAPAYLGQAEARAGLQQYDQAVAALDAYLKNGGKAQAEVYRLRGRVLTQAGGRHDEAIAAFTVALEKEPNDDRTHVLRGWLYVACEDTRLALTDFQKAIALNARNADAHNGRGLMRARLGQVTEAVADAEQALRLAPAAAQVSYDAARIYALATGQVERELAAPPLTRRGKVEDLRRLRSDYSQRAVALLQRTLTSLSEPERTKFWRDRVLHDNGLDPIRNSAEFARLKELLSRAALAP
jgi:tetratricopeptide (TPR) repeat protein